MRVEDVPGEWMEAADRVPVPGKPMTTSDLREALAAVAPLIAKAERERCAELADVGGSMAQSPGAKRTASSIAAAIRALGDTDE